ncbi:lasso peptide biosynthesis B2 protein [Paenibacillus sepulcri]|uniref:Lasso peptide biosynthesis B2 protein n=1 Tax=Paenibacillus sepulcri TaxID=359917 RepID=A0ABS7BVA4_9BACL|nr:lasso peptide biosynthesis B2 protein [Paenibacillus sepulcri]
MRPELRMLLLEAFFYLGWARILKALPFSRLAPSLGKQMEETTYTRIRSNEPLLADVARAIHMVSRHTFWESKCLVMAIAGMKMLGRRQIESTLYMGTARDASGKMIAHAWLRSGAIYLTGADEIKKYTVVAIFGKQFQQSEHSQSRIWSGGD